MTMLLRADEASFNFRTGAFLVGYAPHAHPKREGWIVIRPDGVDGHAIGTKLANGQHLEVTDAGSGTIYRWREPRKDRDMLRQVRAAETADGVAVTIASERRWAEFTSVLSAPRAHPGLLHWTVTARTRADKIFDNPAEPDCHFLSLGDVMAGVSRTPHRVVRYAVQRGPAAGLAWFRDLDLASDVFYFEDLTALQHLYRLTGCAQPFTSYTVEGQPGAVRLGAARGDFQYAQQGDTLDLPWKPWSETIEEEHSFGYHRPQNFRLPAGATVVLGDTWLALKPTTATDTVSVCRDFCEALARIYRHIRKPPIIPTDWAHEVVPGMCREIMDPANSSLLGGKHFFPRAYVGSSPDKQLWTLGQLLLPLTHYVRKYPEEEAPARLKSLLEESLPLFWDPAYGGFTNSLPPVDPKAFTHTIYLFNPAIQVADLALAGNSDARRMIVGYRERLLRMGRTCGHVFADVLLGDYSHQRFAYQFDNTCAFLYVMMALYEMSGRTDTECLDAAKAAAERIRQRCMDMMWEVNLSATGAVACQWLADVTGDPRYRDLAFIPLANTLRWAWLWDSGYGAGEHVTTFWGFCSTPASPQTCEYESHQARGMLKAYAERAADALGADLRALLRDSWRRGPTQSRFAIAPLAIAAGAKPYLAAEGPLETDCGVIRYDSLVPFEDVRPTWGTDLEWFDANAKIGHIGQEIYGAGGPIWYALWQDEIGEE